MRLLVLAASLWVLPASSLTPGVTRPISTNALCATKWGHDRRFVSLAMKQAVAKAYGVDWAKHAAYEFDHLIPRELGGADDKDNLWPQRWPSAHKKDQLENRLHVLVCRGDLSLDEAQRAIVKDWPAAFRKYVTGMVR